MISVIVDLLSDKNVEFGEFFTLTIFFILKIKKKMIKMLSAFKNDAGFADMFDEMLLINQSKVSHFRTLVAF